jgi:hypothetical protein
MPWASFPPNMMSAISGFRLAASDASAAGQSKKSGRDSPVAIS